MRYYDAYPPYVPVAQRRANAAKEVAKRAKKGEKVSPVTIEGRLIASTFWGKAWCENLEGYSDFENRLPRGRTYVRNGSVIDLQITKGLITALVMGTELYKIRIEIAALPAHAWTGLKEQCTGKIGTLVELLQGKLSKAVMETVTDRVGGLFPKPKEIKMKCSCPDSAGMCKHIAAAMYGVGNRLDASPELLFVLRAVDHAELIEQAIPDAPTDAAAPTLAADDLGAIFGIDLGDAPPAKAPPKARKQPAAKPAPEPAPTAGTPPVEEPATKKPAAAKKPVAAVGTPTVKERAVKKPATVTKTAKPDLVIYQPTDAKKKPTKTAPKKAK